MASVAEILERNGVSSKPSKFCGYPPKIPLSVFPQRVCMYPEHEMTDNEADIFIRELKSHVVTKGYGDFCHYCRQAVKDASPTVIITNQEKITCRR